MYVTYEQQRVLLGAAFQAGYRATEDKNNWLPSTQWHLTMDVVQALFPGQDFCFSLIYRAHEAGMQAGKQARKEAAVERRRERARERRRARAR